VPRQRRYSVASQAFWGSIANNLELSKGCPVGVTSPTDDCGSGRLAPQALSPGYFFPREKSSQKTRSKVNVPRSGVSGLTVGGGWPLRGAGFAKTRSEDPVALAAIGRSPHEGGSASKAGYSHRGCCLTPLGFGPRRSGLRTASSSMNTHIWKLARAPRAVSTRSASPRSIPWSL